MQSFEAVVKSIIPEFNPHEDYINREIIDALKQNGFSVYEDDDQDSYETGELYDLSYNKPTIVGSHEVILCCYEGSDYIVYRAVAEYVEVKELDVKNLSTKYLYNTCNVEYPYSFAGRYFVRVFKDEIVKIQDLPDKVKICPHCKIVCVNHNYFISKHSDDIFTLDSKTSFKINHINYITRAVDKCTNCKQSVKEIDCRGLSVDDLVKFVRTGKLIYLEPLDYYMKYVMPQIREVTYLRNLRYTLHMNEDLPEYYNSNEAKEIAQQTQEMSICPAIFRSKFEDRRKIVNNEIYFIQAGSRYVNAIEIFKNEKDEIEHYFHMSKTYGYHIYDEDEEIDEYENYDEFADIDDGEEEHPEDYFDESDDEEICYDADDNIRIY